MTSKKEQSKKFIKAAQEFGCEMTTEEFAKTLKGIANIPPMTNDQVKKKAKKKSKA